MILSIGRVVYMYSLANFLDRDSVHCGGRPILAPPPLGEFAATESGVATSAMARLCDVPVGSGPESGKLWARGGETRSAFEAKGWGHFKKGRRQEPKSDSDRSCLVSGRTGAGGCM